VAFGIQANAINALSLHVYLLSKAAIIVPIHLHETPIMITAKANAITDG